MNVRLLLPAVGLVIGLLAFGCRTETNVVSPDQGSPGITVSGSGSVFGQPDVAVVTLGVEAQAASVGDARTQAAERMDAMISALKDGGVADDDIQTTRFSVQPLYDFTDGRQVLRGFIVSNVATAKIREIDNAGTLIDAALGAGGDLSRVESLNFTIDDPSALEEEARTKAVEDAAKRAQTLAAAAGVGLGKARSIVESRAPVAPFDFDQSAFAGQPQPGDVPTPLELGQLEVQVEVQVVYGLD